MAAVRVERCSIGCEDRNGLAIRLWRSLRDCKPTENPESPEGEQPSLHGRLNSGLQHRPVDSYRVLFERTFRPPQNQSFEMQREAQVQRFGPMGPMVSEARPRYHALPGSTQEWKAGILPQSFHQCRCQAQACRLRTGHLSSAQGSPETVPLSHPKKRRLHRFRSCKGKDPAEGLPCAQWAKRLGGRASSFARQRTRNSARPFLPD